MLNHIRHFAEAIGPRPTGSPAEAQALSYCEQHLHTLGYAISRHAVAEIKPHTRSPLLFFSILTAFTAGTLVVETFPWLLLGTFLILRFGVIPRRLKARQRPYPGGLESFNVSADQAAPEPHATLILGAHLDTALASTFYQTGWRAAAQRWFGFGEMIKGLLLLVGLAVLQFIVGSTSLIDVLRGLIKAYILISYLVLCYRLWEVSREPIKFAAGANDNASGVAVVLGLADHFAAHPPRHLHLRYMVFCAEEVGLVGSERYASTLTNTDGLYMLNFDMVGSGHKLQFVPTRHAKHLNTWMSAAGAKKGRYLFGTSDFKSFAKRKIPALGLYTTGDKMITRVYHTTGDGLAYINEPILVTTRDAVIQFIERLDAEVVASTARAASGVSEV